jgi:3-oxoacyl-[acyl-carrier-protein] synthase III
MIRETLGLGGPRVYNAASPATPPPRRPIALDECVRAGRIKPGDLVVGTASVPGSCGSVAFRW